MGDYIRFDKIFDKDLLERLHSRFKEHIKTVDNKTLFTDIIKNEIIKADDLLKINTKFEELDINMNETEIAKFFQSNCYVHLLPKMLIEGHVFTKEEKAHVAGYSLFTDCQHDKDYPYEDIDEQTWELYKDVSEEFRQTSFEWTMKALIKRYKESRKLETINEESVASK